MSGKPIKTYQVRVYMKARELGLTQAAAACVKPSFQNVVASGLKLETTNRIEEECVIGARVLTR